MAETSPISTSFNSELVVRSRVFCKSAEVEVKVLMRELVSGTSHDPDFEAEDLNEPHRLNQAELSDLIRDLDLPKQKARASDIQSVAMKCTSTSHQGYRVQDSSSFL
ncbi:hypothetical protein TNCV_4131271 [Trichonephila clavipes]|nr:hypothetical protein TNCV_4131271 [Trichonephila clavipes]